VTSTTGTATEASLYDGANLLARYSPSGSPQTFVNGAGLNTPLEVSQGGTAGPYYYLSDALGSTTALTNPAGSAVTTYAYSPFGTATTSGAATSNPLTYTGQAQDPTGLYYYHDRYYDPATHRFISTDPAPASNPYTYADNSPTNFIDPTGADAVESALLFQYDQAIANDFQALLNGIVNYLQTCASAELTPGANSSLACSQGFLSASIIYNEVQAADSTGLGLVVSDPFVALTVGSLFSGAAAAGQTALDQSVTGPLSLQPIVSSGVASSGQAFQAGIFGALAGAAGATSDPLKLEAPTTADIVNFEGSYFINAANSAGSAQSCYLTFTSGKTAC